MSKYLSSMHPSSSFKRKLTGNKARYPGILPAHLRVLVNAASLSWPLHISSEKWKMIAHCFDCFLLRWKDNQCPLHFSSRFAVPAERQWSWSSDKICWICRSVKKKKKRVYKAGRNIATWMMLYTGLFCFVLVLPPYLYNINKHIWSNSIEGVSHTYKWGKLFYFL